MTISVALKSSISKTMTVKQVRRTVKYGNDNSVQKNIQSIVTVPTQFIGNDSKLHPIIYRTIFDKITDRTNQQGVMVLGNQCITGIEIKNIVIHKCVPTLFKRSDILVEVTFLIQRQKFKKIKTEIAAT